MEPVMTETIILETIDHQAHLESYSELITEPDGIYLVCSCGWEKHLGSTATIGDATDAWAEHTATFVSYDVYDYAAVLIARVDGLTSAEHFATFWRTTREANLLDATIINDGGFVELRSGIGPPKGLLEVQAKRVVR